MFLAKMNSMVSFLLCLTYVQAGIKVPSNIEPVGPTALKQRIINGEIVDISLHPHQVSLQYNLGLLFFGIDQWFHLCGGSVIGRDLVLTAAHCVDYNAPELFRVVLNDHNINDEWTGDEQIIGVNFIFPHEDYTNGVNEYENLYPGDVAVLKLSSDVIDENSIITMDADRLEDFFVGADCKITGWGVTDVMDENSTTTMDADRLEDFFVGADCKITGWGVTETGSSADELREANMTLIPNEECNQYYPPYIYEGHVCIFNGENNVTGAGACNGDSGGPLVCDGKLVGVTSWGIQGCRLEDGSFVPSVYARVSYFHGWIEQQLQKFSIGRG